MPRPRIVLQFQFDQFLLPVLQGQLLAAEELRAERRRRMLARVQGSELHALLQRTLRHLPFVLFAGLAKKLPGQNFAMDEEVVVQDGGGCRKQVGLFMFFLLRSSAPLLRQKIRIRKHHRFRFLRAQLLPLVTPDIPGRGKLHLGTLHVLGGSILGLELGINDAAVAGLIDRKRLGSHAMAILEHAEGTGVDVLPLVLFLLLLLLLLFFGHGSGRCRKAPGERHHERRHENEQPIKQLQLQCDSPVPKPVTSMRDKPDPASSGVPLSCNTPSISTQIEANCLPVVSTTTLAWR